MTQTVEFLQTQTADGRTVVSLPEQALVEGRLAETRDKLLAIVADTPGSELRLDFGRVTFLGSSALAMLVMLHRRAEEAGGHVVLDNVVPYIQELFRLTRLDTILDVRATAAGK